MSEKRYRVISDDENGGKEFSASEIYNSDYEGIHVKGLGFLYEREYEEIPTPCHCDELFELAETLLKALERAHDQIGDANRAMTMQIMRADTALHKIKEARK